MKNAVVLVHHIGDRGNVGEGRLLLDLSEKRFGELKGLGLVREATKEEVEAGDDLGFVAEGDAAKGVAVLSFDVTGSPEFLALVKELEESQALVIPLNENAEIAATSIAALTSDLEKRNQDFADIDAAMKKLVEDHAKEMEDAKLAMEQANIRAKTAEDALAAAQTSTSAAAADAAAKEKATPANKKAADPANKAD